jgi:predicted Fe-Mo cluster-binding NifX family protein
MRVAFSTDGDHVSAHFGRCPFFTLIDIEDGKVVQSQRIPNPGHHPGFLPKFLQEKGVSLIVAGGMGRRAEELFDERNIERITGVSGTVDAAVRSFAEGRLTGGESICKPGGGKGYGLDKTECEH